jgi:uncharacterized membrane protein
LESWWEIVSVFLLSTVKFVFGAVPFALGLGFSFFEAVTVTTAGGFTGVTIFVLMSERIVARIKRRKREKLHDAHLTKKKFTRKNKMIVRVKLRFGLLGIAFLTPLLLSIPIGCFLAVRYFQHKQKIIIYMFCSIIFWSVAISSLKLLFNVSL